MRQTTQLAVAAILALACAAVASDGAHPAAPARPQIRAVPMPADFHPYLELLSGPPETASMESGLVTLLPGHAAGVHNTERFEEVLLPLDGEGELRAPGRAPVKVKPGVLLYVPPHTEHDVANTGTRNLKYVFVAARAE